jgi:hypothetical protein
LFFSLPFLFSAFTLFPMANVLKSTNPITLQADGDLTGDPRSIFLAASVVQFKDHVLLLARDCTAQIQRDFGSTQCEAINCVTPLVVAAAGWCQDLSKIFPFLKDDLARNAATKAFTKVFSVSAMKPLSSVHKSNIVPFVEAVVDAFNKEFTDAIVAARNLAELADLEEASKKLAMNLVNSPISLNSLRQFCTSVVTFKEFLDAWIETYKVFCPKPTTDDLSLRLSLILDRSDLRFPGRSSAKSWWKDFAAATKAGQPVSFDLVNEFVQALGAKPSVNAVQTHELQQLQQEVAELRAELRSRRPAPVNAVPAAAPSPPPLAVPQYQPQAAPAPAPPPPVAQPAPAVPQAGDPRIAVPAPAPPPPAPASRGARRAVHANGCTHCAKPRWVDQAVSWRHEYWQCPYYVCHGCARFAPGHKWSQCPNCPPERRKTDENGTQRDARNLVPNYIDSPRPTKEQAERMVPAH